MRRIVSFATVSTLVLVLAACNVSVSPAPPTISEQVDATVQALSTTGEADLSGEPAVAGSVTLAPGEDRVYRIQVPSSQERALFLYTNAEIPLYVYGGNERLFATSSSSLYFAPGTAGLAGASLRPSAIAVAQTCPGSCIIVGNPGEGSIYLRVRNPSSSSVTFTVWAVLRGFADANEDFGEGDPAPLESGTDSGALETLQDEDFFEAQASGQLTFDAVEQSAIDFVAEISDPFGGNATRTVRPGETTSVAFQEVIRVYADNARAAVSANSQYFLTLD